ncbi:TonB-dependent receptor domain-containing protein [Massilia horti]|uniref:TonB-dependent receptor n=1 Tax=Massilia horti TaxID=2562153 RepID=A0A4Y9T6B5_9BURK|nr:TonB-dependent receptor [Massilia horti]TFW32744.1 TonB-dependent receptor [Massilia horti]
MQQRTKITIAVAVALHSMGALAQEQSSSLQRVEITGSRIRQVDVETSTPVTVMTQEQIQKTGLVTVGDIVNSLSSTGSPSFARGNALTSNREQGGQFPSLRGLGGHRLLVLVNGKRWTQTVSGYTDMSTIPSSLIDRVEISSDGGSSIYGSDAIAGVVNIILKKSMEGGQASAYVGQNELGDGKNKDYSLSYGTGNDKANLMFALSHTAQGAVWAKDREITRYGSGRVDRLSSNLGAGPWGRITAVDSKGASTAGTVGNKYLNHTGGYDGSGTGADSRNPANYHTYNDAVDEDKYNSSLQMHYLSPSRMTSIFVKGSVELPQSMRLTTTAMYADRFSSRVIAGYPLNSLTQSKYPVYIDKDNYYNPYGNQVAGAGKGQDLFFYRRTIEVPRGTDNTNRTLHIDATLEGELNVGSKTWNWDIGYNHSAIAGDTISTGNLNLINLKRALGPSFKNASGVVQCGTPANPIPLAECVPWDILGGPSAATPAALNYSMAETVLTYGSNINSATANITGEVYDLPAGAIGVATGLEYRTANGYDRPDMMQRNGFSTDLGGMPTTGSYNVKEAYVEVNVPLLKGMTMAELLSINVASRYSDYSNFGSTTNSKASFMWKPIKDLLVRGTYAQGFRAPTLNDTFGGGSQSYDSFLDPCDSAVGNASREPEVAARCAALGVPAGYRQRNQAGSPVTASTQNPYPSNSGAGNADIRPETSETRTVGLVYSPSWVNGLSLSLDWWDILIKNRIAGVSASQTLTFCYVDNVPTYCNKVRRDSSGAIVELNRGNTNLGAMHTRGIDFGLKYRFPRTQFGQFGLRSDTTYVNSWQTKSTNTADYVEYVGESGYSRFKNNSALDWSLGNWSANLGMRFYSRIDDKCPFKNPVVDCNMPDQRYSGGLGVNQLPSNYYFDLSVAYKFPWNARLMVGANNVFDKKPFLVYTAGTSSSSAVDSERPIDRFIWMRYNQSF